MNADPFLKVWGGSEEDLSESSSIESQEDHRPVMFQLQGGVASLQRGDDFGDGIPQRMYVVGRGRTKMFNVPMQGPRKFQGRAPLTPSIVWTTMRPHFKTNFSQEQFVNLWSEAVQNEQDTISMNGNAHNLIQGPGKFAYDIRLTKLLPLKDRSADINDNISRTEAIRKLRSLHTTLVKAFGPYWIRMVQGSRNVELVGRQMDRFTLDDQIAVPEDDVSIMDPFADFRAEDLVLNSSFGERTFTNTSHEIIEIQSQNGTKLGCLFGFQASEMVSMANSSTCAKSSEVVRQQDLHNASRKVIVSPNDSLLIASQKKSRRNLRGGSDEASLEGGSLENLQAFIPMLAFSHNPEDLLASTMSTYDTCSRQGSVSRIRKIQRDFANRRPRVKIQWNSTSALYVVDKDHEDLQELEWDLSSLGRCSVATMSLGPDVGELWKLWQEDTDPHVDGQKVVGCATAQDCLQSFSRRIEVADSHQATPDLLQLADLVQTFEWKPLAGKWLFRELSWAKRHVQSWNPQLEIAYQLTCQMSQDAKKTLSSVLFSIPGICTRIRS